MIFHLTTLTPDSAVAASLLPIEYAYRPRMVLARITAAMTMRTRKISTPSGNRIPGITE